MSTKRIIIGREEREFYTMLERSPDAPLTCVEGSNALSMVSTKEIGPEHMTGSLLEFLRAGLGSEVNYNQGPFRRGEGAPEASGVFYRGDHPLDDTALMQTLVWTGVYVRPGPTARSTVGNRVTVYPLNEAMLGILKSYNL